ncbi:MAG: glycerol-3-phosphate 1-O-acyltransferase PlsY [Castellaniella sp.]|uniref:glycerol-3-phosphate 1-O-acyltransferase PlsY n=1 Tax=Castellaniella sp. TaxID=1955812 RepID=UPI002A35BA26|nr:glycerol-3-phosphate 1-O-acyltransferase PlsY [Castellaniella sp.]MDY0309172.1 glycerol-3-phosphate 1-O-acyltransferase PlsY [Castellaniella sp.]
MTSFTSVLGVAAALLTGYLMGSIPFAVVVSRAMGLQDPRSFGSGNPGATNVLRGGNKLAAVLTLIGDAAKGWLAVALAAWAAQRGLLPWAAIPLAGLGAFLGHLYPLFLRFRGGKGVATALGVLLALQPWLALATAATWLIVALVTRYSSLAAILAAVFAPFYYILGDKVVWRADALTISTITVIGVLLLARHRENIARLLAGKESKIGAKKK